MRRHIDGRDVERREELLLHSVGGCRTSAADPKGRRVGVVLGPLAMKGAPLACAAAAAAAMQETFGCAVTNRFNHLLDDESDPFDILREAEERKQRKKKEEGSGGRRNRAGAGGAAAGGGGGGGGGAAAAVSSPSFGGPASALGSGASANASKSGRRESQKARKIPAGSEAGFGSAASSPVGGGIRPGGGESTSLGGGQRREGPKRGPKRAETRGQNENQDIEKKTERSERRVVFRERRPNEPEGTTEFSFEVPIDRIDRASLRGRGGRGRGRGRVGFPRSINGFDPRGRREYERHSGNDKVGMKPEEKRGGSGSRNWGAIRDDPRKSADAVIVVNTQRCWINNRFHSVSMKQRCITNILSLSPLSRETEVNPAEEMTEMEELQEVHEGDVENKLNEVEHEGTVDDGPHEMTLDEWKALQEQTRSKKEFNIRKPDSSVLSKAVVIHKSKYEGDEQKEESDEEDHHYFRRSVNDITSKLDINFGSLTRPGRGRGGARGRGRGKRITETRPEVPAAEMIQISAPNPDDPEDFPALA
ncbi:intracellular hyaluronan-binding protein 4.S-like isoform X1 [Narcine bancroftii]|uniref:intracellular hyaluronan-binding protein 4.S-like isoform X1 n=1 Tax=Narcine bancroftii TaxID=1343680 RepID=UPI003831439D